MKARPILMSAPMIVALLAGRKGQTRRIVKPQPDPIATSCGVNTSSDPLHIDQWQWLSGEPSDCDTWEMVGDWFWCQYGRPGDLLWVRETWQHSNSPDGPADPDCSIFYRADYLDDPLGVDLERSCDGIRRRWVPSIHMPRTASRLTLRITDVRVERLQDISEEDANAEGVEWETADPPFCYVPGIWPHSITAVGIEDMHDGHERACYAKLWDHINGTDSWAANPWVWALSFDVIKQNVDELLRTAA